MSSSPILPIHHDDFDFVPAETAFGPVVYDIENAGASQEFSDDLLRAAAAVTANESEEFGEVHDDEDEDSSDSDSDSDDGVVADRNTAAKGAEWTAVDFLMYGTLTVIVLVLCVLGFYAVQEGCFSTSTSASGKARSGSEDDDISLFAGVPVSSAADGEDKQRKGADEKRKAQGGNGNKGNAVNEDRITGEDGIGEAAAGEAGAEFAVEEEEDFLPPMMAAPIVKKPTVKKPAVVAPKPQATPVQTQVQKPTKAPTPRVLTPRVLTPRPVPSPRPVSQGIKRLGELKFKTEAELRKHEAASRERRQATAERKAEEVRQQAEEAATLLVAEMNAQNEETHGDSSNTSFAASHAIENRNTRATIDQDLAKNEPTCVEQSGCDSNGAVVGTHGDSAQASGRKNSPSYHQPSTASANVAAKRPFMKRHRARPSGIGYYIQDVNVDIRKIDDSLLSGDESRQNLIKPKALLPDLPAEPQQVQIPGPQPVEAPSTAPVFRGSNAVQGCTNLHKAEAQGQRQSEENIRRMDEACRNLNDIEQNV